MLQPTRSRTRQFATAAALALLAVSVALVAGCGRKAAATSSASSASTANTTAAQPGGTATKPASGSTGAGGSATSSASTASGPAWRTADPAWMQKYEGVIIDGFKTQPDYKAVALTFDDGPNGETAYVINTLKKYKGEATFFDTGRKLKMGWAKGQPLLIEDAGFELGNHTMHHTINNVSSMWHRTPAVDLAEINDTDAIITANGGQKTIWLRPMGGEIDATAVKAAVSTNHLVINWTIDSNDSHGGPRTPDYIYQQCTTNVKSGDVILLHVTHPESMQALPRICATLSQEGFKLVTLSDLAQHSTGVITQKIVQ